MFENPEMKRINRLILSGGGGMTESRFFAAEIKDWLASKKRAHQILGSRYYAGQHDILTRQRTMIGEDGQLQTVGNLPNNKVVDNQFALMVDQKTNYLLGKPFTRTRLTPTRSVRYLTNGFTGFSSTSARTLCAAGSRGYFRTMTAD